MENVFIATGNTFNDTLPHGGTVSLLSADY
jgi:hypothetical protein